MFSTLIQVLFEETSTGKMPRKSTRRSPKQKGGMQKSNITVIRGTSILPFVVATTTTSVQMNLDPTAFFRLNNLQDGFEFYRFTRIEVVVPPWSYTGTAAGQTQAVLGYYPEETASTTTTLTPSKLSTLERNIPLSGYQNGSVLTSNIGHTTNQHLRVGRSTLLRTPVKWYRTVGVSGEDTFDIQGSLLLAVSTAPSGSALTLVTYVRYVIEFTGIVDSTALALAPPREPRVARLIRDVAEEKNESSSDDFESLPSLTAVQLRSLKKLHGLV